jgi:hypothetical protein
VITIRRSADGVFWYHADANQSPRVTPAFIERQRRLLPRGQFEREHRNQWVDAADAFTTAQEVTDAMDGSWAESPGPEPGAEYVMAVDLGLVHDPSVVGVGHQEAALICVDRLVTFQGSREEPASLAAVDATIVDLARTFHVSTITIESWQGAALVQALAARGFPAIEFRPTPSALGAEWALLGQMLASRRLVLPVHARLREELLGLAVEVGPSGPRVLDRGTVHQDHAVVVRMLAARLAAPAPPEPVLIALGW